VYAFILAASLSKHDNQQDRELCHRQIVTEAFDRKNVHYVYGPNNNNNDVVCITVYTILPLNPKMVIALFQKQSMLNDFLVIDLIPIHTAVA